MNSINKNIYREYQITMSWNGFHVCGINCFGCSSIEDAMKWIDIYLDGNTNPQCL